MESTDTVSIFQDAVRDLAADEPTWLGDARRRALEAYQAAPLPDRVKHLWRYTDPKRLLPSGIALTEPDSHFGELPADCQDGTFENVAGYALARDGRVLRCALDPAVASEGVVLSDLREAATAHEDVVRAHLFSLIDPTGAKFEQLSCALFAGGTFVHVPRGVTLDRPLRIENRVGGEGFLATRSLIVVEDNAQATVVFDLTSADAETAALVHEGLEVHVGQNADLRVVFVQAFGRKVRHAPVTRCRVGRDARLETISVALGASLVKSLQTTELAGRGCDVKVKGIIFADGRQHLDHHTLQEHLLGHNTSDLDYRTVVADRARSAYTGNLRIGLEGAGADAHQRNHNLLLSDSARADTIPELEILTDDVQCSHAAAVGPIDQDAVYFCMSRGLSESEARKVIIAGFLEPVITRIPDEKLVERVRRALAERLDAVA